MMNDLPVLVLVHGAFSDGSIWRDVARGTRKEGYTTLVPAIPLRGMNSDAEYLADFVASLDSPVVLAGHSYGGALISHPALSGMGVRALVFVSAFAADSGESPDELNSRWPGSKMSDKTTLIRSCPDGRDVYLKPEYFGEVYAGDLNPSIVTELAFSQRPVAAVATSQSFEGNPTWKSVPSWTIVSAMDQAIPAEAQRFMANRANAKIRELGTSHASPLADSRAITEWILQAAKA